MRVLGVLRRGSKLSDNPYVKQQMQSIRNLMEVPITNGCNYCMKGKQLISHTVHNRWYVDDVKCELRANNDLVSSERIYINFCPMCGRRLK